ncbi:MAG TPA: hypothetical protein VNJ70_17220 [Thermoanaerobaculia bacterium]|nr:hypothetical protein [Thermoanaerobaculia bacterium]
MPLGAGLGGGADDEHRILVDGAVSQAVELPPERGELPRRDIDVLEYSPKELVDCPGMSQIYVHVIGVRADVAENAEHVCHVGEDARQLMAGGQPSNRC